MKASVAWKGRAGKVPDEFGELTVTEHGRKTTYPCYTCAHCNKVIVMRADRTRERKRCLKCGGLVCEKTQLCREICTPINQLAKDHFSGNSEYGTFAPAILNGAKTIDEALEMGLQKEN